MPRTNQRKLFSANGKKIVEDVRPDNFDSETELDDDSKDDQIAELQELVRTLKIENTNLKKKLESIKLLKSRANRVSEASSTPVKTRRNSTQGIKQKETGCSCSGSCVNKKCGCVKKDIVCSEFCKCGDKCKNHMADDEEDKENHNNLNKSKKKSVKAKNIPDQQNAQNQPNQSGSDTDIERSPINSTDQTVLNTSYNIENSTSSNDNEERNSLETISIDPLKPRYELPRSPLQSTNGSFNAKINSTIFHDDNVFLPIPKSEPEDELPPPDEIHQMEVDWEQHQANLVPCRKCSRKFHAYRIKKHEQSCKKI